MSIVLFFFICVNYFCKENEKNFCFTQKILDGRYAFLYNRKNNGVIAQLVARLNGIQKVRGSTPLSSTKKSASSSLADFFYFSTVSSAFDPVSTFFKHRKYTATSIPNNA